MIYIATHKHFEMPHLSNYCGIQVGASGKDDLGYLRDDIGNSISKKNPNFCELTGLYWIWKNCNDEHKGLVHYRRYFGKSNLSRDYSDIYTYEEMMALLKNGEIVLPYVEYFKQNAKEEILSQCCTLEIFNQLRDVIREKSPTYLKSFDDFFSQNKAVLFNMMFCKRELFDMYCAWLFEILFELEKRVDLSVLNAYQQRLYGFLSERLLNVWIAKNKLKTIHTAVINTEMSFPQMATLIRRRITNRFRFRLKI